MPRPDSTSVRAPADPPSLAEGQSVLRRIISSPACWLGLLLAITTAIYWPGFGGGYAFDDYPNIVFNTALQVHTLQWPDWLAAAFSSHASELQRPLAMLSFAIQHYFTGLEPAPFKRVNVVIHLINALLVFALVRALLVAVLSASRSRAQVDAIALMTTAWWALLPINLTAVLLIVQRMEILSHTFVFAGLWLYVSGRQRQLAGAPGWLRILTGLIGCTALGLLSKESAALLPLYAFCLEVLVFRFRTQEVPDCRLLVVFILVLWLPAVFGVAWLLPRALDPAAYSNRNFDLGQRLLTEPRVLLDYLHWILLPSLNQLALYHDDYPVSQGLLQPPVTLLGLAAIPAFMLIACWLSRRRPLVAIGLWWFLAAQALTATFLPLELVFEHRNYFASLGVMLVLADLLLVAPTSRDRERIGWFLAVLLLLLYGTTTHLRALEWSNPLRFAISEARKHPLSPRAAYQLGQTYASLSERDPNSPFVSEGFKALEHARSLPHAGVLPVQGLLILAARSDRRLRPEWWQDLKQRLARDPIGPQELGALGAMTRCAAEGHCAFPQERMFEVFTAALNQGQNAEILNIQGDYLLRVVRRPEMTLQLWREAAALSPGNAQYHVNLAKLLISVGDEAGARDEIRKLRRLASLGQTEYAARELEQRLDQATRRTGRP